MVAGKIGYAQLQREWLPSPDTAWSAHEAIFMAVDEPPDGLSGLSLAQSSVAHVVVRAGGWGTGWCYLNITRMAMLAKIKERAVRRALAAMVTKGWLRREVRRLPTVNVALAHYRLTPVLADIATDAYMDAVVDEARAADAARKARQRPPVPVPGAGTVPVPGAACPALGAAEYSDPDRVADSTHVDPVASSVPTAAVAPPRKAARAASKAPPRPPSPPTLYGVPLPDPLPPRAHGSAAYLASTDEIVAMLADQLPTIDPRAAWGIAVKCSAHNMTIQEVAEAILLTRDAHGSGGTIDDLVREIDADVTPRRRFAAMATALVKRARASMESG